MWVFLSDIYTAPRRLATLQSVDQQGTRICFSGHNIVDIKCIYFKFGTINIWYMANSKNRKMNIRKYLAKIM